MPTDLLTVALPIAGTAIGVLIGAGVSLWTMRSNARTERAKILATVTSSAEVEKSRVESYKKLWLLLGRCSTYHAETLVADLSAVQDDVQRWYYDEGGGLLIAGSYEDGESTKAALFALRDLDSRDRSTIWQAAHNLRHCLRRDLRIFEDPKEERRSIERARARLEMLAN
jgi:hypothetical protein